MERAKTQARRPGPANLKPGRVFFWGRAGLEGLVLTVKVKILAKICQNNSGAQTGSSPKQALSDSGSSGLDTHKLELGSGSKNRARSTSREDLVVIQWFIILVLDRQVLGSIPPPSKLFQENLKVVWCQSTQKKEWRKKCK